jgi:hypothetical protein
MVEPKGMEAGIEGVAELGLLPSSTVEAAE